jgi:hypothetical protein
MHVARTVADPEHERRAHGRSRCWHATIPPRAAGARTGRWPRPAKPILINLGKPYPASSTGLP